MCETITEIEAEAFAYTNLTTIEIPDKVRSIGNKCFTHCSSLVTFTVSSESSVLQEFHSYVFEECNQLESFHINNTYFISERGVLYSRNLTKSEDKEKLVYFPPASDIQFFSIPYELSEISTTSFYKCHNLKEVLIPDESVRIIGESAFEECDQLRYINIPKCVVNISRNAFKGCQQLSCGLLIEDLSSIETQLLSSGLPHKCLHPCFYTLHKLQPNCHISIAHIFLFIAYH